MQHQIGYACCAKFDSADQPEINPMVLERRQQRAHQLQGIEAPACCERAPIISPNASFGGPWKIRPRACFFTSWKGSFQRWAAATYSRYLGRRHLPGCC
jgi:hypothetical protein